jgi:hypothetical protein
MLTIVNTKLRTNYFMTINEINNHLLQVPVMAENSITNNDLH